MSCFGGLKNVIIAVPEISVFKIKEDVDFLFLGCDGIYDQLSNSDIVDCVWMTLKDGIKSNNIHNQCSLCVDMIIKSSLVRKTIDNVTGIFIAFENFEKNLTGHTTCNNQLLTSIELNSEKSFSPNFSIKESPDKKLKPQESFKNFISNYESNDKIFYENLKSFESSTTKNNHLKNSFSGDCKSKEYFQKIEVINSEPNLDDNKSNDFKTNILKNRKNFHSIHSTKTSIFPNLSKNIFGKKYL
jgi:hypothetical protein